MAYNNASEIKRIQRAIADRRAQLESCYALLGKQYVERHRTESGGEFSMLIGNINEHEATLKILDDQVLELRGLQRCVKCGAEMPLTSRFCNICGSKAPEPPAGQRRCPTCGKLLPIEARFCNGCGNPVASASAPYAPAAAYAPAAPVYSPAPAAYAPAAPAPAPAAGSKTCPNCGSAVESDCMFCTECGTKL